MSKTPTKFFGGNLHSTQHSFDDVAMVAKKPSRLSAVVAMVGSDLPSVEGSRADGTPAFLNSHKLFDHSRGCARPPPSLTFVPGSPTDRIIFQSLVQLFRSDFGLSPLRSRSFSFNDMWLGVVGFSAGLHFRARSVFAKSGLLLLKTTKPVLTHLRQMCGPFFRSALSFGFPFHTTQHTIAAEYSVV